MKRSKSGSLTNSKRAPCANPTMLPKPRNSCARCSRHPQSKRTSFCSLRNVLQFARVSEQSDYHARFDGIQRLYGQAATERFRRSHVCVVGIGGVGSWAVEALARTGIGALTLVDMDEVCVSNINRQLPALSTSVGRTKTAVMSERVHGINPDCAVHAREEFFTRLTADSILTTRFDCVVDAIDSVSNKSLLIARCRQLAIPILTVGAAGGRQNPTALRVTDLTLASHDRLLAQVRKVLRVKHAFPRGGSPFGVLAIYSAEAPKTPEGVSCAGPLKCEAGYGTATFVTGTFGFAAAACAVRLLLQKGSE